jgi:hypothetical membrane protein
MSLSISIDDFKSKGRLCCLSTIFAALQFLLLTFVAALFYPGGYDYFGYNFSDLGTVLARNGASNSFSSILFLITATLVAIFMIPTWLILPSLFKESTAEKVMSYLGSGFGFIASPLLIGLAIFPADTENAIHNLSARLFFLAFGLAILIYSIAILFNQNYSNYYSIIGLAIFLLVVTYVFDVFGVWSPFIQKVIIYSYILWAFIQVFRIWPSVKPQIN